MPSEESRVNFYFHLSHWQPVTSNLNKNLDFQFFQIAMMGDKNNIKKEVRKA